MLFVLKVLTKVGVFDLALTLAALPVAACVVPGVAMTNAERDCCKKMAEQCGHAGMAKSHPCCQISAVPTNLHAFKTSAVQSGDFNLLVSHCLLVSTQHLAVPMAAPVAFQVSDVHGPPGLESLSTTVLRI